MEMLKWRAFLARFSEMFEMAGLFGGKVEG
jgi:hypothetical protein